MNGATQGNQRACGEHCAMSAQPTLRVSAIDSHTGGEPTRVVIGGGPDLGTGPLSVRAAQLDREFADFRRAVVNEPRGNDVLVGAILVEPTLASCGAGVIFFNTVGTLGMCGHGTIGLMATLAHLGRAQPGPMDIETPVGVVTATLHDAHCVSVRNVPSFRHSKGVRVNVEGIGNVTGDVAWGGNWFFITEDHGHALELNQVERLTQITKQIRAALERDGVTGADGAIIDHIELNAPSPTAGVGGRNFILCPGGAYDRSPCGTGTSAKLACLFADGKLAEGQVWRQESIVGSVFEGSVEVHNGKIVPTIRGTAYVTAEAELILDPDDPFVHGFSAT